MAAIVEDEVRVEGLRVFVRRIEGEGTPTVLVHGNPTHSADWLPVMERMRGPAIAPDLPGWGRTERPRWGYTMQGLASFFERLLAELGVERHRLAVHDWGALALISAQRFPDRIERLLIVNSVPLLPGYRWHRVARLWRRRGLGELATRAWNRRAAAFALRQARGDRQPFPDDFIEMIWSRYDRGTARAILSLYRSAPEQALAAAGAGLDRIECPALVIWGDRDPYLPARFGSQYAERLPDAVLSEWPGLGHWPWREDRAVIEEIVAFLESGVTPPP